MIQEGSTLRIKFPIKRMFLFKILFYLRKNPFQIKDLIPLNWLIMHYNSPNIKSNVNSFNLLINTNLNLLNQSLHGCLLKFNTLFPLYNPLNYLFNKLILLQMKYLPIIGRNIKNNSPLLIFLNKNLNHSIKKSKININLIKTFKLNSLKRKNSENHFFLITGKRLMTLYKVIMLYSLKNNPFFPFLKEFNKIILKTPILLEFKNLFMDCKIIYRKAKIFGLI